MKQPARFFRKDLRQFTLLCLLCSISAFASAAQVLAIRNFVDYAVAGNLV